MAVNGKAIKKNSHMAKKFNKYFTNVGPNLTSKIENTSKTFENFIFPIKKNMEYGDLAFKEFEKTLESVKHNKAAERDDIDSNVIIRIYDEISDPFFMIFHRSLSQGIFPKQRKVSNVSLTLKLTTLKK